MSTQETRRLPRVSQNHAMKEDGPFYKAFVATFAVLIAVTLWMLFWGMVALIVLKLNGFEL